jgi:hypothetical protein
MASQCNAEQCTGTHRNASFNFYLEKTMKSEKVHEIVNSLRQQHLLDYGSVIKRQDLLQLFGIPIYTDDNIVGLNLEQIRSRLKNADLQELAVSDHIRRILLLEGKYFERNGDTYRVAMPSENAAMADNFMKAAQRKIRRARVLLKNTPGDIVETSNLASRLLMAERSSGRTIIQ